jgi:DNA-binding NarL/FixJ family response regulator
MESHIRVVVAACHTLILEGLALLLQQEEELERVGKALNDWDVLQIVEQTQPDVLLFDWCIQEMTPHKLLPQIRERCLSTKVLLLVEACDQELILSMLRQGARGYILKSVSSAELFKAIRAVHAGEAWVGKNIMGCLLGEIQGTHPQQNRQPVRYLLSLRETEITRLVATGYSNREIANQLSISEKTVKSHLASIYRKLHINGRLKLALHVRQWETLPRHQANGQ